MDFLLAQTTPVVVPESTEVVPYLVVGMIVMYVQRYLKRFDFYANFVKKFPAADENVHRIVAGVLALIAALGIHYTWTGDADTGWAVHLQIPALDTMLHAGWDWIVVFVLQQGAYDMTWRPAAMPHDTKVT